MSQGSKNHGSLFDIDYEKFLVGKLSNALGRTEHTEAIMYRKALVAHYNGNMVKLKVREAFPLVYSSAVNTHEQCV